jgi:hypothetical protein
MTRFWIHLKATILKRLRVIKRDYKSFGFELLLPIGIIILAFILMRVSFISDFSERQLSFATYAYQSTPLVVPVGSVDPALLNSIEAKLKSKYGSFVSVAKDTTSVIASDFDRNFLKYKKLSTPILLGGLFFNGPFPSRSEPHTVYEYTTLMNTKIPTSMLYLQTLGA